MSRLLLVTDSNFLNNVGGYKGRKIGNLEVKSCQSRRTAMATINGAEEGILIVACLDMIAADIAKSTSNVHEIDRVIEMSYDQLFQDLIEKVEEAKGALAVGVVAPLFWTSHSKEAARAMSHAYKLRLDSTMKNIMCTDFLRGIRAGVDGTHLTSSSAHKYIEFIYNLVIKVNIDYKVGVIEFEESATPTTPSAGNSLSWAEEVEARDDEAVVLLGPPAEDLTPPMRTETMLPTSLLAMMPPTRSETMMSTSILSMDPVQVPHAPLLPARPESTQNRLLQMSGTILDLSMPPPASRGMQQVRQRPQLTSQQLPHQPLSLASLDNRIVSLEEKSFYDNLTMAALKEDLDTEANRAMLNRVSISGVEIPGLERMDEQAKIKAMRDKANEIITVLKEEGQAYEVQFVRHLNKQIRGAKYAVIEVKFGDAKQAKDLRAEFVKKRKSLPEKVNITPIVRLATRVRVEMMHSIAAMMKRMDPTIERAMCLQYAPKPVIKVARKTAAGVDVMKTMSFTESITWIKSNGLENRVDLAKAYERAGASSRGTLAQTFVLLN